MRRRTEGHLPGRKRRADPEVDRPGTGNKPIMVKTDKKEVSAREDTAHQTWMKTEVTRQDKVVNILKKHEKAGNIKHAGSTDKGELFDIKKPACSQYNQMA